MYFPRSQSGKRGPNLRHKSVLCCVSPAKTMSSRCRVTLRVVRGDHRSECCGIGERCHIAHASEQKKIEVSDSCGISSGRRQDTRWLSLWASYRWAPHPRAEDYELPHRRPPQGWHPLEGRPPNHQGGGATSAARERASANRWPRRRRLRGRGGRGGGATRARWAAGRGPSRRRRRGRDRSAPAVRRATRGYTSGGRFS